MRCHTCARTHVLLPAELQPRRADSTEVIGTALLHKAQGLGFRRIAAVLDQAESTVRRWLRRATGADLQWVYQQGAARLITVNREAFTTNGLAGQTLNAALQMLGAAAHWDARICGFNDPPWP